MRFSKHFKLGKAQAELDFVDVDVTKDLPVYVDPYAIELRSDNFAARCNLILREFFVELLDAVKRDDEERIAHLVSNFHEPGDTFLGVSEGLPQGRGMGKKQTKDLVGALRNSEAAKSGKITDLSEATLFIPGIGKDKISDLTTNLIRVVLVDYTQSQCELHGIESLEEVSSDAPLWSRRTKSWKSDYVTLPTIKKKPVLLVPKYFVRRDISLQGNEFYKKYVRFFLQAEHEKPGDALASVVKKTGELKVTLKKIEKRYPFTKEFVFDFYKDHPNLLEEYKKLKRLEKTISTGDLEEGFLEPIHAKALKEILPSIVSGNRDASRYHNFMVGVLTFLFHPGLVAPVKEREINEGRKRIDILFRNSAMGDFFHRVSVWDKTSSGMVPVECKNYTSEVANEELDQLLGRFSHSRGWVGFLFCRSLADRERMLQRSRDAARDGLGYTLVFDDEDVLEMLSAIEDSQRSQIERKLSLMLDAIL